MLHNQEILSKTDQKWAVVTGASSGIGEAIAKRLAQECWGVVLVSEQPDDLQRVHREISAAGGKSHPMELDLLRTEEVDRFAQRVQDQVGFCEVLINNAGIGLHKTLLESNDQDFQRVFTINFFSVVTLCRSFLPSMFSQGKGHIVNISSASARRSLSKMSCYGASKAALHGFSQALRLELEGTGVAVTEILPISVQTPFFKTAGYQPKGLVQTPDTVAAVVSRALVSRQAEICTSALTAWGFVLDTLMPNVTADLLAQVERRRRNRE